MSSFKINNNKFFNSTERILLKSERMKCSEQEKKNHHKNAMRIGPYYHLPNNQKLNTL